MAEATYYGTGRRKTSVARVRLVPGQGNITINGRDLKDYFDLATLELIIKQPLELTGTTTAYDVIANVKAADVQARLALSVMASAVLSSMSMETTEKF